jgi:hypothetical protein
MDNLKLHPGLIVRINKNIVASISSENLNIISVRVSSDILATEVADLNASGGYYGTSEETRHLLWVTEHAISEQDEIEIQFQDLASNSHPGRTIEEIYPESPEKTDDSPQDLGELAVSLQNEPRVRDGFDLHVHAEEDDPQTLKIRDPDYSFIVSVMWNWKTTDSAKFSVSSTTIENIAAQRSGTSHLQGRIAKGQSLRMRIASVEKASSRT